VEKVSSNLALRKAEYLSLCGRPMATIADLKSETKTNYRAHLCTTIEPYLLIWKFLRGI